MNKIKFCNRKRVHVDLSFILNGCSPPPFVGDLPFSAFCLHLAASRSFTGNDEMSTFVKVPASDWRKIGFTCDFNFPPIRYRDINDISAHLTTKVETAPSAPICG